MLSQIAFTGTLVPKNKREGGFPTIYHLLPILCYFGYLQSMAKGSEKSCSKKKKKNLLDQLGFSHSILACRLLEEYMLYCGLHPHLHGHVMNDLTHRWPEHESSREEVVLKPLLPRGATAARCSGCFTIMLLRYQIPRTLQRADLSGRSVVTTRSVKSRRTHLGARV